MTASDGNSSDAVAVLAADNPMALQRCFQLFPALARIRLCLLPEQFRDHRDHFADPGGTRR
jgi:hypothetical protein